MKKTIFTLSALIFASSLPTAVSAETLVTYPFGSAVGSSVSSLLTSATDLAVVGHTLNSNVTTGTYVNLTGPGTDAIGTSFTTGQVNTLEKIYGQVTNPTPTYDATNTNGLFGADVNSYINFTITAASALTLGTFEFDMASSGTSGPRGFVVTAQKESEGFSIIGKAGMTPPAGGNFAHYSFDLSSISALAATDILEIRMHAFSGLGSVRFDNVTLTGAAVAVPEPSTYAALFGLAALGFVAVRRRRQQQA